MYKLRRSEFFGMGNQKEEKKEGCCILQNLKEGLV